MSHIIDIVAGSCRALERDGKPFQAARLTPSPNKLPLLYCRNVSNVLQMRHVRATKTRNGGYDTDLEAFETARFTPGATKLIIVNHHVTDVLQMNEQFECDSLFCLEYLRLMTCVNLELLHFGVKFLSFLSLLITLQTN